MLLSVIGNSWVGPQVLTFAIPLGTLFVVLLWAFFGRSQSRR